MGPSRCREWHTLRNTSKLQPVVRRPVRGSSFPRAGFWVLPKLHLPAGVAAHTLLRTRTLPCAEWGLCVAPGSGNTAWSIPWQGTCRAGLQMCDTHSDYPSACCFCLSLLPFTDKPPPSSSLCQPRGSLPFPLPTSHFKGWDFPRGLHLLFSFVGDENNFLPGKVDSHYTVIKEAPPLHQAPPSLSCWTSEDSPGTHPEHLDHEDHRHRREGSFFTCYSGTMQSLPPTPIAWVEQERSAPALDHFPNIRPDETVKLQCPGELTPSPAKQFFSGSDLHPAHHFPGT